MINGNCSEEGIYDNIALDLQAVKEYLDYQRTGRISTTGVSTIQIAGDNYSRGLSSNISDQPLFSFNTSGAGTPVSVDFASLTDGDFPDVEPIQNSRPSAFPSFLMDWVTRQIQEFSNGLTTFPGITIILPSFEGVFEFGDTDASELDPVFSTRTQTI